MSDQYLGFEDLSEHEHEGRDYEIQAYRVAGASSVIVAPHAGGIELRTGPIARRIAGSVFSLYLFTGKKPGGGNAVLHITSHRFDEPRCLELLSWHRWVVTIHGSEGVSAGVCIGGLDHDLVAEFQSALTSSGIASLIEGHPYPGEEPLNICNRGASRRGVQFELSLPFRRGPKIDLFADVVRTVLEGRSKTGIP